MTAPALTLTITQAGLARFTAAQVDEDIDLAVSSVGLTNADFAVAPTLETLPGEFRRLQTISGQAVSDNIVHMIIRDDDPVGYQARGFGLFLADGTLFAAYGQPTLLFEKSPATTFLAAIDIAFPTGDVTALTFGDANFLNPPATTTVKGVVELATPAEGAAGTDAQRVPPIAVVQHMLRLLLPIGTVVLWSGSASTVPTGWAICDGQSVPRSDGAGAIATPDLRDRVVVGAGGARASGDTFGAASKTVNTSATGDHAHGFNINETTGASSTGITTTTTAKTETAGGGTDTTLRTVTLHDPQHAHAITITGATGGSGAHQHQATIDVTQPSLALFYIMKV